MQCCASPMMEWWRRNRQHRGATVLPLYGTARDVMGPYCSRAVLPPRLCGAADGFPHDLRDSQRTRGLDDWDCLWSTIGPVLRTGGLPTPTSIRIVPWCTWSWEKVASSEITGGRLLPVPQSGTNSW